MADASGDSGQRSRMMRKPGAQLQRSRSKNLVRYFFLVDLTTQVAPRHYMGRWHSEPPIAFKTLVHSIVIVII